MLLKNRNISSKIKRSKVTDYTALKVCWVIFHFYSNFDRTFCKQTVYTQIRHRNTAASDLGLHCLPMSYKKDATLIWVHLKYLEV